MKRVKITSFEDLSRLAELMDGEESDGELIEVMEEDLEELCGYILGVGERRVTSSRRSLLKSLHRWAENLEVVISWVRGLRAEDIPPESPLYDELSLIVSNLKEIQKDIFKVIERIEEGEEHG